MGVYLYVCMCVRARARVCVCVCVCVGASARECVGPRTRRSGVHDLNDVSPNRISMKEEIGHSGQITPQSYCDGCLVIWKSIS